MTSRLTSDILLERDEIVAAPAPKACDDQTFELPGGLYVAMGSMFAGFVGVLALGLRDQMAVSYAIIFAFLAAFFAVPALFVGTTPSSSRQALSWHEFLDRGVDTATGRVTAREATLLVLLLPFLILCFGVAVAVIAAV